MAMLAEPRRKEKWTLNPRGKLWSEDKNKFGQRMLEKMGWSEGKGLGASEQGATSHIAVKFKSDNRGLGNKINDAEWCRHQERFENLLGNLNSFSDTTATESLKSLEEISKKSRNRLHYSKFTRGKDLTLYSKKDLDCILGIGVKKQEKPTADEVVEDIGAVETFNGVTTIVGGTLNDYFKKKVSSVSQTCNGEYDQVKDCEDVNTKKRKRMEPNEHFVTGQLNNVDDEIDKDDDLENHPKKKRKKKSKSKIGDEDSVPFNSDDQVTHSCTESNVTPDYGEDLEINAKTEEKKRINNLAEDVVEESIEYLEDNERVIGGKKKKKKKEKISRDLAVFDAESVDEKQKGKVSKMVDVAAVLSQPDEDSSLAERLKEGASSNNDRSIEKSLINTQLTSVPSVYDSVNIGSTLSSDSFAPEKNVKKKKRNKEVDSGDVICVEKNGKNQERTNVEVLSDDVICIEKNTDKNKKKRSKEVDPDDVTCVEKNAEKNKKKRNKAVVADDVTCVEKNEKNQERTNVEEHSDDVIWVEKTVEKKKKKRYKAGDSDDVMCVEEIIVIEDKETSGEVSEYSAKSKKGKERGNSEYESMCPNKIPQLVAESCHENSQDEIVGAESYGDITIMKELKRKEKKSIKRKASGGDDVGCELDKDIQSLHKKSKKKRASVAINDNENPVNDEAGGMNVSDDISGRLADSELNSSDDTGNQNTTEKQLSRKSKGSKDTEKQDGEKLEINYFRCCNKKVRHANASEVVHLFQGSNLKEIIGYGEKVITKD